MVRRGKKGESAFRIQFGMSAGRNELVKIFTDNAVITQMQRQLRARRAQKAHLGRRNAAHLDGAQFVSRARGFNEQKSLQSAQRLLFSTGHQLCWWQAKEDERPDEVLFSWRILFLFAKNFMIVEHFH